MKGASVFERLRETRRIAQPPEFSPSPTDIPYRVFSIFPSLLLARIGLTPNQITLLWIVVGLIGVVALGFSDYWVRVAGVVLLQFSYLLDFVDGEVARLQQRSSKLGSFLDLVGHGLIKTGLFLALGYYVWISTGRIEFLLLAFSAVLSISNGHTLPFYAAHASVSNEPPGVCAQAGGTSRSFFRKLLGVAGILFESPGLYGIVLLGAVFGRLVWVVIFYGLLGPLWFLHRAIKYRYE